MYLAGHQQYVNLEGIRAFPFSFQVIRWIFLTSMLIFELVQDTWVRSTFAKKSWTQNFSISAVRTELYAHPIFLRLLFEICGYLD